MNDNNKLFFNLAKLMRSLALTTFFCFLFFKIIVVDIQIYKLINSYEVAFFYNKVCRFKIKKREKFELLVQKKLHARRI